MDAISSALSRGATLVTPGSRLARRLRNEWSRHKESTGFSVWTTPDVLPWPAWIRRCWKDLVYSGASAPPLLSPLQAALLWEQSIAESPQASELLNLHAAAGEAAEAWELLHAWRLPLHSPQFDTADDPAAFRDWAREYEARCRRLGYLDSARLPDLLIRAGLDRRTLCLAGFDELTPQQAELLAAMDVVHAAEERVPGRAVRTPLADTASEIEAAAQWSRELLERTPGARIGIAAPHLDQLRSSMERQFAGLPFHLSLGPRLAGRPVVHAALLMLEAVRPRLPGVTVSGILLTPWIAGAAEETSARARFDASLRRRGEVEHTLRALVSNPDCPPRMAGLLSSLPDAGGLRTPSAWSRVFSTMLAQFGWPGPRVLSSEEYQTVETWKDALASFASLDAVSPAISADLALELLRRIAAETVFEPEDRGQPIQVLGLIEAASETFDHLWILGLDGETWPRASAPNPFLPLALQRAGNLPHSSPERELAWARRLTSRLLGVAPDIVVSWPETQGERDLAPSPLIAHLPTEAPPARPYAWYFETAQLETVLDQAAPPVPEDAQVPGGARVLQLQAACPFRAFAEIRLHARPLESFALGLDARQRGNVLHAALQYCWSELESQRRLLASSPEQIEKTIERAVHRAIRDKTGRPESLFEERVREVEQRRLTALLTNWLDIERRRAGFTVLAPEQKREITVGGLALRARIDRLDRLDDGRLVVIDYKSTAPKLHAWEGDRPDEPQLPLYATSFEGAVAAVAFAQVKTGDSFFRGSGDGLPGVESAAMNELLAAWRTVLAGLAEQFRQGHAAVDPKTHASCDFCPLDALCRIREQP